MHSLQGEEGSVSIPINLYSDDISGNRSKKYNCFNSVALMVAGLPRSKNYKLHNIHFVSTSNKVNSPIVK